MEILVFLSIASETCGDSSVDHTQGTVDKISNALAVGTWKVRTYITV